LHTAIPARPLVIRHNRRSIDQGRMRSRTFHLLRSSTAIRATPTKLSYLEKWWGDVSLSGRCRVPTCKSGRSTGRVAPTILLVMWLESSLRADRGGSRWRMIWRALAAGLPGWLYQQNARIVSTTSVEAAVLPSVLGGLCGWFAPTSLPISRRWSRGLACVPQCATSSVYFDERPGQQPTRLIASFATLPPFFPQDRVSLALPSREHAPAHNTCSPCLSAAL